MKIHARTFPLYTLGFMQGHMIVEKGSLEWARVRCQRRPCPHPRQAFGYRRQDWARPTIPKGASG